MLASLDHALGLFAAVVVYWIAPATLRSWVLVLSSMALFARIDPVGIAVLVVLAIATYGAAPAPERGGRRIAAVVIALVALLVGFQRLPAILAELADEPGAALTVPLGISYLTFRLIHYAVDRSRGELPRPGAGDFFSWALFPPIVTAGPIERIDHFLANRAPRPTRTLLVEGATRIVHGFVKKFALAHSLVPFIGPPDAGSSWLECWRATSATFVWVYLDFSAYSDFAIGAARLFGVRIEENFRWPLLASDIADFWRRWHRTLVSWCRDYVYFPLAARTRNALVAVVGAWVALALWHDTTASWLAWGLYHAGALIAHRGWTRLCARRGWTARPGSALSGLRAFAGGVLTFLFVSSSFAFTLDGVAGNESPWSLADGLALLRRLWVPS